MFALLASLIVAPALADGGSRHDDRDERHDDRHDAHGRHAHAEHRPGYAPRAHRHHAHAGHRHAARRPPPRRVVVVRQAPPPAPRVAPHSATHADTHNVSLTLSAVHLAVPMATANVEFALGPKASLGVTGGLGAYQGASLVELGGEARAYAVGNFDRGLYLGANARFTSVPYYTPTDASVASAVFVGGKYTFAVPLVIEGLVGPQLAVNEHGLTFGPAVKLNVGFAF